MEKYTMSMHWKNQYSENEYTTQSNLQIQCNPYQAINYRLHLSLLFYKPPDDTNGLGLRTIP